MLYLTSEQLGETLIKNPQFFTWFYYQVRKHVAGEPCRKRRESGNTGKRLSHGELAQKLRYCADLFALVVVDGERLTAGGRFARGSLDRIDCLPGASHLVALGIRIALRLKYAVDGVKHRVFEVEFAFLAYFVHKAAKKLRREYLVEERDMERLAGARLYLEELGALVAGSHLLIPHIAQ